MQCVQLLLVESWHEKQYTCLVVKRRTAVASPATSTIIATVCVGAGSIESLVGKCRVCSVVVESWYERQYTCLVVKRRTAAGLHQPLVLSSPSLRITVVE